MSSDKLARIHWQMGQALLPEHLESQEESILAEMRMRFALSGLPHYGISKLQWNDSLLKEGVLSILALTIVLPSGELIDIPGNAKVQPFNMNVAGSTKVSAYLHIIDDMPETEGVTPLAVDEESIDRIFYTIELSPEKSHGSALHTFKLAEFDKGGQGEWALSDEYMPPLLQVGTSPFLMTTINYLRQLLEAFLFKLSQSITASYLSGENLFTAKQCLQGVYKLLHFFCNLQCQIHFHPYHLYEALKIFYIELCFYQNSTPENIEAPYLHEQLSNCFKQITEPLMRQMQAIKAQTPYLPFKKNQGIFSISKLPKEVADAKEVYFLFQKPHITTPLEIEGLKLASMSRLSMVHQMSLNGIPFKKISRPPFQHTFGAEVDFFIIVEGEEWDYAIGEKNIAFYDTPALEGANAYLYWRES